MSISKQILIISPLDIKEKSIQVTRKTLEAYRDAGWNVWFVVSRDESIHGDYFYETEIDISGIEIFRFSMPFSKIHSQIKSSFLLKSLNVLRNYLSILKLAYHANKILKTNSIDVIYGYTEPGILAVNLLRILGQLKNQKIVSRMLGTFYINLLKSKQYLKIITRWDFYLPIYLSCDLFIMTNDGTSGDLAVKQANPENYKKLMFWTNGVDEFQLDTKKRAIFRQQLSIKEDDVVLLSVSRLVKWKRVDRIISLVDQLVNKCQFKNVKYLMLGDGNESSKLKELINFYQLDQYVLMMGSIPNEKIKNYLDIAEIFISTYDGSNVGNPLLEAIRANKIIFTLNNGDTATWITHENNGFIYDINDDLLENMAKDVIKIARDKNLQEKIITNITSTSETKLWTWRHRMCEEIKEVEKLLNSH